ncbi:MAG: hypothetical protein R2817_12580 [Flavobacteriales bacterium]
MTRSDQRSPGPGPWRELLWWIALIVLMGSMLALATLMYAE